MTAVGHLLILVLGGLLLGLARLSLLGAPGGDRAVGFAWSMLVGHAAVFVVLLALTLVLAVLGRLPSTPVAWSERLLPALLFVGASSGLAAATAIAAPTGGAAAFNLATAARLAPLLVPLLLTIVGALLLTSTVETVALRAWPARMLAVVGACSVAMSLVLAAPGTLQWADVQRHRATRQSGALDSFQQQMLDRIDAADPAAEFASLLVDTREGNHRTIRDRAVARLLELADWESRVRTTLSGPDAYAAFIYLASHDVSDPASFAEPAAAGVRHEAARVRGRIRNASHPSHLYEGLMVPEVDAVLRTIERLPGHNAGLAAALRELRAAFAEPADWPHPNYRATAAIDRAIRRLDATGA
jgi:hypothetical protein